MSVFLGDPTILGADQNDKTEKEPRKKSSNMSKVINMWENSHGQVDCNDHQQGHESCHLKIDMRGNMR